MAAHLIRSSIIRTNPVERQQATFMWQFNPYIIPFVIGAMPLTYAAVVAWRRRDHLPEKIFFWLALTILWSILVYSVELSVTAPALMLFLRRVQYMGGLAIPTLLLLFILAQTGREQFITRRNVGLLFVEPVLYHLLIWTNEYHHLHWQKVEAVNVGGLVLLAQSYANNPIFWFGIIYLYGLIIVSFYLVISKLVSAASPFRTQYLLLLAAMIFPWAMNFIDVIGLHSLKYLEVVLYGMMFSTLPLAWGLFRHRLLDLTPAAHDMVMRSIGDAVFVLDREDRVVDANPAGARLLGSELSQIIGRPARQVFAHTLSNLESFEHTANVQEQVTWGAGKNERCFDVLFSPLYNHWGQLTGRVITIHELTHQKQAERQAIALALEQEKVRLLQQFIDASSHDLSTPITTLLMSVNLLKHSATQVPEYLRLLRQALPGEAPLDPQTLAKLEKCAQAIANNSERIDVSVQRLQKLLAGMLELARLDKTFVIKAAPNDLNQLIQETLSEVEGEAQARKIQIHYEADPTLGQFLFDPHELRRVLKHLLQNALNFTPYAGAICIKTGQCADRAILEVSDTGIGIASEDLPFVFDRFYRGDKARSAQTGGMGVGLAVVKKIVTAHNGTVEVMSTPEKGSTFRVTLPLA